jgi:hypothetical protein
MLVVVTRQVRYVTHMCDVTCNVTEAKYGVLGVFDDYNSQCVYV